MEPRLRRPEVVRLVAILGVRISPRPTPKRLGWSLLTGGLARQYTDPLPFQEMVFGYLAGEASLALTD